MIRHLFLLLVVISNAFSAPAKGKTFQGLFMNFGASKLKSIDKENFSGNGLSVSGFKQKPGWSLGIGFFLQIPVYKKIYFESGLGYDLNNANFYFNYYEPLAGRDINTRFRIGLHYLKIPVAITYDIPLGKNSSIIMNGGVNVKYLALIRDNWDDASFEEINIGPKRKRYRNFVYGYVAALSYQFHMPPKNKVEIGLQLFKDLSPMTTRQQEFPYNYGFYKNLRNSKFTEFGIYVRYFI